MSFQFTMKRRPSASQPTASSVAQAVLAQQQPRQQANDVMLITCPPPQSQQQPPQCTQQPQQQPTYPWSARRLLLRPPLVIPKPVVAAPSSPSPPPFPRYGHALPATATTSGELYIFGGLVRKTARNDLYLFSTHDLSMTLVRTRGEIPSPRVGHASAIIGNVLIVWGGDTKTGPLSDQSEKQDDGLYLLDLVLREWFRIPMHGPAPAGRFGHAVTMVGTKFFVFGGQVDSEFLNDLWSFDLNTLLTRVAWERQPVGAARPTHRTGHACITYQDRIIVFGGTDGHYLYNDTWSFDTNTNTWSELQCIGSIPSPREGHAAAVVDDIIYIFGGRGVDGKDIGDLAAFKMSNQRWYLFQNMGPAPSRRSGHAMASMGTRVFVLGGESFTPTKGDDPGIINVLDTKHIEFPEDCIGPPPYQADQESFGTPTPPPGQAAPGSSLPGARAMSLTYSLQDADDRAITKLGTWLGPRTPNGAHAQSFPNTKGKAPMRPRRDGGDLFETDVGNGTETGAAIESTTTSRDHAPSSRQTRAPSHSPRDLTSELQGRSRYPITSGGFGDIWKCDLVKPDGTVQVAVKTIRAFESDNEVLMRKNSRRVRRELKVWGRLKHDSILPLWGVATDFGPYPAMICPWADNGALTGYLERQESVLSSAEKFSLLNDIALGLQYLHSKSVVHGDLTGSNVLISSNGRACLADFGLSTIILEFVGTSYFTSSIRGNVRWVAAELCEVSEDDELSLSTECDIYSFGSITLQVLTCKVPYYNVKKDIAVLGQVIKGMKPEPPKESHIAPGHWQFIQRCWSPRASRPSIAEIVIFIACE
ncbi:kinase-like domain-containing protein [Suillus lakei]|nr:kinase-like domain-containing protein [Suillus lakei]